MWRDEYRELLMRGPEIWNEYKRSHPYSFLRLDGLILSGLYLRGVDFNSIDLSNTSLNGADLSWADFSGARLEGTILSEANLSDANLIGVDLRGADLINVNFCLANLSGADLRGAQLSGASLGEANLSDVNLGGTDLSGINFDKAFLYRADLSGADLRGANLSGSDLYEANLSGANLSGANLSGANLCGANLGGANLIEADLSNANLSDIYRNSPLIRTDSSLGANLSEANLSRAKLCESDLSNVNLHGAILTEANLRGATLKGTHLEAAVLVRTDLYEARLVSCYVYGVSAWGINLDTTEQSDLIITDTNAGEPTITVDNLEVAQFIYLLLNNQKVRNVIDTVTSKAVLILGRFTPERKAVLDSLREELSNRNYLPILFDFDKPASRDLTETVSTLAHLSRFIIADITEAKGIPQELSAIVPNLPSVAVQPILLESDREWAMFEHFRRFPWLLEPYQYRDQSHLLATLVEKVIVPAEMKARELLTNSLSPKETS